MRMPPNPSRSEIDLPVTVASKRGGMRMPPNQKEIREIPPHDLASKRGGMRMPPNIWGAPGVPVVMVLQRGAACACRRIWTI